MTDSAMPAWILTDSAEQAADSAASEDQAVSALMTFLICSVVLSAVLAEAASREGQTVRARAKTFRKP